MKIYNAILITFIITIINLMKIRKENNKNTLFKWSLVFLYKNYIFNIQIFSYLKIGQKILNCTNIC